MFIVFFIETLDVENTLATLTSLCGVRVEWIENLGAFAYFAVVALEFAKCATEM